jgi:hypothetical protein
VEASGVASARPNQCADGMCPKPPPPNDSTHPAGSSPYLPPQPPQPPAPTQTCFIWLKGQCVNNYE